MLNKAVMLLLLEEVSIFLLQYLLDGIWAHISQ